MMLHTTAHTASIDIRSHPVKTPVCKNQYFYSVLEKRILSPSWSLKFTDSQCKHWLIWYYNGNGSLIPQHTDAF
jgi:hypothetical protein